MIKLPFLLSNLKLLPLKTRWLVLNFFELPVELPFSKVPVYTPHRGDWWLRSWRTYWFVAYTYKLHSYIDFVITDKAVCRNATISTSAYLRVVEEWKFTPYQLSRLPCCVVYSVLWQSFKFGKYWLKVEDFRRIKLGSVS